MMIPTMMHVESYRLSWRVGAEVPETSWEEMFFVIVSQKLMD